MGIWVTQVYAVVKNVLNGALKICAFYCMHILPQKKNKRAVNKYWTLVNSLCAEVFRDEMH